MSTTQDIKKYIEQIDSKSIYPYFWEENCLFQPSNNFTIHQKILQHPNSRKTQFIEITGNPLNIIFNLLTGTDSYGLSQDILTQIIEGKIKLTGLLHGDPRYPFGGFHTFENRGDDANATLRIGNEEAFTTRTNLYPNLWYNCFGKSFNFRTKENPFPQNEFIKNQNKTNQKYAARMGSSDDDQELVLKKYPILWTQSTTEYFIGSDIWIFQNVNFMRDNGYKVIENPFELPPIDIIYATGVLWHPLDDEQSNLKLYRKLIFNILNNQCYEYGGTKILILSNIGLNYFIGKNIKDKEKANRIRNLCIDIIDDLTTEGTHTAYDIVIKVNLDKNHEK